MATRIKNIDAKKSTSFTRITPTMAAKWLKESNTKNRRIRKNHVRALSAAMARGEWVKTHEAIAFDTGGEMVDGQHRLHAVVDSGVTIPCLVVTGLSPLVRRQVDGGAPRTIADRLTISGDVSMPPFHCARFVSAANAINRNLRGTGKKRRVTYGEVLHLVGVLGGSIEGLVAKFGGRSHLRSGNVLGVLFLVSWAYEKRELDTIMDALSEGVGLKQGSALLTWRNYIIQQNSRYVKTSDHGDMQFRKGVKCVAAHFNGEELKLLRQGGWERDLERAFGTRGEIASQLFGTPTVTTLQIAAE